MPKSSVSLEDSGLEDPTITSFLKHRWGSPKSEIPKTGKHGIPLLDEWEFEKKLV